MGDIFIYIAYCIVTHERYVGRTINGTRRWRDHFGGRGGASGLWGVIEKHGADSIRFAVLEYCTLENIQEREEYWIRLLAPELNSMIVSGGRVTFTDSTKNKFKRENLSEEIKRKRSASVEASWADPEAKEQRLEKQREVLYTPELNASRSVKHKALLADSEYRKRRNDAATAAKQTPEFSAKMSAIRKEYWAKRKEASL